MVDAAHVEMPGKSMVCLQSVLIKKFFWEKKSDVKGTLLFLIIGGNGKPREMKFVQGIWCSSPTSDPQMGFALHPALSS